MLCGESYLKSTLNKPIHAALKQRITVHYEYKGLSDKEISEYIVHKISIAGGTGSIITPDGLQAIAGCSHGNTRVIDNVMSDALLIGEQMGKRVIDSDVILAANDNRTI